MDGISRVCSPITIITGLLLHFLVGPVSAQLNPNQRTGLIIGCSIGGAVVIIVIIVLLVLCYKSTKKNGEVKKKNKAANYVPFHDPSAHKVYNHPQPTKAYHKASNGQANGHVSRAVPKLERSFSDSRAGVGSGYAMPEWKKRQDRRDSGSQLSGFRDNGSDISGGIWTSNPTLTRGLYPGQVVMATSPNGRTSSHVYGSESALNQISGISDKPYRVPHGKGRAANNKDNTREDTRKLIQKNGQEADTSDQAQTVAKAYNNNNNPGVSPAKTPQRASSFVAKVYSDYQKPKDLVNEGKPKGSKIVKAYSAYSKHPNKPVVRQSDKHTDSRHNHVGKAVVSQDTDYYTSAENFTSHDTRPMTQSEWTVHDTPNRPVTRSQSNVERGRQMEMTPVPKTNQPQRSTSHAAQYLAGNWSAQARDRNTHANPGGAYHISKSVHAQDNNEKYIEQQNAKNAKVHGSSNALQPKGQSKKKKVPTATLR